jgi:PIN domain nuclease of toxin-antitoxin system
VVLLLDTHVWLWALHGDTRRVGRRTRQLLSRAESRETLRVSVMTLFEVAALHALGRIRFTRLPEQWIRESFEETGIRIADLSPAIAIDAGSIPRSVLADPLDRLLVATARHLQATFLTSDERILDYGSKTGEVRVHDAGT